MSGRGLTYAGFGAALVGTLALALWYRPGAAPEVDVSADMAPVAASGSSSASLASMDREALRGEIRDYILEEPELILEAFRLLEAKRVADEAQSDIDLVRNNSEALFNDGFSFVGGNPEGSITMVEFQDYRCGYCKRAHSAVKELVESDGDIRLVIKEFPILGADSTLLSELAIATKISQGDDAYARISDAFMTYAGPVNDAAIERLAKGALVDIDQSRAALKDEEVAKRIAHGHSLGQVMNISGTPTFVIGEKIVRGFLPLEQLEEVVELSRRVQN